MMNNLARLGDVKADPAGVAGTTALDDVLVTLVDEVSREFETETGREFRARLGTWYLTGNCRSPKVLTLPFDVASITSLAWDDDGDESYGTPLVADTDFFAYREDDDSNRPICRLEINPNSTLITYWPTAPRALKLVGLRGYSYELEDTTLSTAETLDAGETAITLDATAASLIFPGDTAVIDAEQYEVTSVAAETLTVVPGINGTTAAAHDSGAAVYVRRYPRDIERVVKERAVGLRWDSQGGYDAGVTLTGDVQGAAGRSTIRGQYARWLATVRRYKRWAVS